MQLTLLDLVAGKVVENPTKYADVVTATTHKALEDHVVELFYVKKNLQKY